MSIDRRAPLTVQNAEVKTTAVEIKTLTVSGKQITLSVFRQIPAADLVNKDGTLNGVPWGRVNYFWGDHSGCSQPSHQHVLWQNGTELFRHILQERYFSAPDLEGPFTTTMQIQEYRAASDGRGAYVWVDSSIEVVEKMRALVDRDVWGRGFPLDQREAIEGKLAAIAHEINKLRAGRRAAWAAILCLPQLYIAV